MSRRSKAAEFVQEGWDITVTGRHVQVTDAMKNYALEKISRIERFSSRIIDVAVTMDIQKLQHRVDVVMKVGNLQIKCHAITDDMYASVDKVVDRIEAQLIRYKDRLLKQHTRSIKGGEEEVSVNVVRFPTPEDIEDMNEEIESENLRTAEELYKPHHIIARETLPLKTLTCDEALLKLEFSGEHFLLFRCEEDQKIKVLYRRTDGDFGLLEPQV